MPTLAALFVTLGRDARDAARPIHPGAAAFSGSSTIAKRGRERDVGERRADEPTSSAPGRDRRPRRRSRIT